MRTIGILLAVLVGLSGQAPPAAHGATRHLVYQFGYNTKAAKQGTGTGTTTIDIGGLAADGGVMITGTDYWWNTARPRAANTCEVYPNGGVACLERPYALSVIQLTIFPLLAHDYFKGFAANPHSSSTHTYDIKAAIIPGGTVGFSGNLTTWNCVYSVQGNGPIAGAAPLILVLSNGKLTQTGGRYLQATDKVRIAYDPAAKIPLLVNDVRTHLPQVNVYNKDLVELKLIKDSQAKH